MNAVNVILRCIGYDIVCLTESVCMHTIIYRHVIKAFSVLTDQHVCVKRLLGEECFFLSKS